MSGHHRWCVIYRQRPELAGQACWRVDGDSQGPTAGSLLEVYLGRGGWTCFPMAGQSPWGSLAAGSYQVPVHRSAYNLSQAFILPLSQPLDKRKASLDSWATAHQLPVAQNPTHRSLALPREVKTSPWDSPQVHTCRASLLRLVLLSSQMKKKDLQISAPPNPGQKINPRHLVIPHTNSRAKPMQHLPGIYLQIYQDPPEHDRTVTSSNSESLTGAKFWLSRSERTIQTRNTEPALESLEEPFSKVLPAFFLM